MGVEKKLRSQGNGTDYPKKGDTVTIEYTGNIYDNTKADLKGTQFDSSVGRGPFNTPIGVGQVIREEYTGWDEGVLDMSLGESATLIISSDYAYGDREVELKAINDKQAS